MRFLGYNGNGGLDSQGEATSTATERAEHEEEAKRRRMAARWHKLDP